MSLLHETPRVKASSVVQAKCFVIFESCKRLRWQISFAEDSPLSNQDQLAAIQWSYNSEGGITTSNTTMTIILESGYWGQVYGLAFYKFCLNFLLYQLNLLECLGNKFKKSKDSILIKIIAFFWVKIKNIFHPMKSLDVRC